MAPAAAPQSAIAPPPLPKKCLDSDHKCDEEQPTPRASEGRPAGAARLGRAALQNQLLQLQGALVDVEGVRWQATQQGTTAAEKCRIVRCTAHKF